MHRTDADRRAEETAQVLNRLSRALAVALLRGAVLLVGCAPTVEVDERPKWLPQWSFPFDVAREREGSFDEFLFDDEGTATWRVQEFCPLERATYSAALRWEPNDDDTISVESLNSPDDTIAFPYVNLQVAEWDCDEVVYRAEAAADGEGVSFRGRTWGRVCVAEDGCSVDFCEGVEPNPLKECPK